MWTRFWDMHSGGHQKLDWGMIYIEAPIEEAAIIFQNKFGRNPHRVTCTCCGSDYSLNESETLEEATAYQRNCRWDDNLKKYVEEKDPQRKWAKYISLENYIVQKDVKVIYKEDISPTDKKGKLIKEGYIWQ